MIIKAVRIFIPDACETYIVGEDGVSSIHPIFSDSRVMGVRITTEGGVLEFYNTPMSFTNVYAKKEASHG